MPEKAENLVFGNEEHDTSDSDKICYFTDAESESDSEYEYESDSDEEGLRVVTTRGKSILLL